MPTHDGKDDADQQLLEPLEPLRTHRGLDDFEFCQPVEATAETNNSGDGDGQQPKKKKQKISCSIDNCTNTAQSGGICLKHGGKYRNRYYCSVEGCTKYPKAGGVCKAHGAKVTRPLCQIEGCTNLETNKGVCIRHGAKVKLCRVDNCPKQALKGGVCWSHGAKDLKVKKKCSVENCETLAHKGGVCTKHGAKRCSAEGCTNQAKQGGVCYTHGATPVKRKLCSIGGCPNQAKVEGYCKRHKTLISKARKEATAVVEAPPGKLGLTLKIDPVYGGARITSIESDCKLKGQIEVGDRVTAIDDHVITQTADFGINSDKTRQFKIAVNNSLENVLFREHTDLGERLKERLSGRQISEMQSQIQRLVQAQEDSLSREAALKIQLERAAAKETALGAQLRDAKSRAKELKEENAALKTSLAREKRRAKKCPNCAEKKSPEGDDNNLV